MYIFLYVCVNICVCACLYVPSGSAWPRYMDTDITKYIYLSACIHVYVRVHICVCACL